MNKPKQERFNIQGKAFWTKIFTPNDEGKFTMDLSVDSQTAAMLKEKGLNVRQEGDSKLSADPKKHLGTENDRKTYVTIKSNFKPKVVDAKTNPITQDLKVGNGSKVNVNVHPYDWSKKKGKSLNLNSVQILTLIEYNSEEPSTPFKSEEGFSVSTQPQFEEYNDFEDEFKDTTNGFSPPPRF